MPPDLTTFVQNLSWAPALLSCCRSWSADYEDRLEARLRECCGHDPQGDWLYRAFLALDADLRQAFLASPEVAGQLLPPAQRPPSLAALGRVLVHVLSRGHEAAARDPELADMLRPFGSDHGDVYGVPLDFDSAFAFPARCGGEVLSLLPPGCRDQARRAVGDALEALRPMRPVAFDFVTGLTVRLAVRAEEAQPGRFTSGSYGQYPGLTLLTNPLAPTADIAALIDALVHEAIHSALFRYEAVHGPLTRESTPTEVALCSPWSGRPLGCNQYVHACFVWFGLRSLWEGWPQDTDQALAERARQLHERAALGFRAGAVEALLERADGYLASADVRNALRSTTRKS
jgi:hypothetical protein